MRVGVLISGFGSNMMKLIESCEKNDSKASIELVFSNNPNAKGIEYAKSKGIKVISIDHKNYENRDEFDNQVNKVLLDHDIEFICNAGFMRIHSDNFVKKWFNRHLNIHPSLLPSFKGLNTHKKAIEAGVKFAGCTVHMVRAGVDEGTIIGQAITSLDASDNEELLAAKILKLEHRLYPVCLQLFAEDLIKVNHNKVNYSEKAIKRLEDFKI
jgi:phosphoribosylglycinamide formyltransferase-1